MSAITNGELELIAEVALEALIEETVPMSSISTDFTTGFRAPSEVVKVPVYPAADAAAAYNASTNNYEDASADSVVYKDVTLSSRIKSTMSVTDAQAPKIDKAQLVKTHIQAVVKQSQIIIMNDITNANFSTAGFVGAASTFDSDDVADLWDVAEDANYGSDRWLVLSTAYITSLLKDNDLKNWQNSNTTDVFRKSELGMLNEFKVLQNKYIPGNSENLVGYITDRSGIVAASGLILPQQGSENTVDYRVIQDPNSGLALVQRAHYAGVDGTLYVTWEALFGSAVGQAAGLDRITSA